MFLIVFLVGFINNRSKIKTALRQAQGPQLLVNRASDREVELAMIISCGAINIVEAVALVEAKQTEHGQEDAHADTG